MCSFDEFPTTPNSKKVDDHFGCLLNSMFENEESLSMVLKTTTRVLFPLTLLTKKTFYAGPS